MRRKCKLGDTVILYCPVDFKVLEENCMYFIPGNPPIPCDKNGVPLYQNAMIHVVLDTQEKVDNWNEGNDDSYLLRHV